MVKRTHEVPVERSLLGWNPVTALGGDLLALCRSHQHDCSQGFLRVPLVESQRLIEGCNIPEFSFDVLCSAAYAPDNLLAVSELRGE